jgi:hypothetical protein
MFPHPYIHTNTWASSDGKTHNKIYHILIDSEGIRVYLIFIHSRQQIVITDHQLVVAKVRERERD